MPKRVPVSEISRRRLEEWLSMCARDHATPLVLIAVGHDEQAGALHVYRTEDGPSDGEIGLLLQSVAQSFLAGTADGQS